MPERVRYAGQAVFYAAVAAAIGYLASQPAITQVPDGTAQIKLSFRHGGARVEDCRRLTPQEIAQLPARERRANDCTRRRVPITVALAVNGEVLLEEELPPGGLAGDGPSEIYRKILVPAGRHQIDARLRDSKRDDGGYDYEATFDGELVSLQNLAIDFKADQGGFQFR